MPNAHDTDAPRRTPKPRPAPATAAQRADANPRLRASPAFVQTLTMDGRPYIAQDTEPYIQYWLTERYRVLLHLFGGRHGARVEDALAAYHRLTSPDPSSPPNAQTTRRLRKAIDDMRGAGVLLGPDDDTSRYDAAIADDYIAHRPVPRDLVQHLLSTSGLRTDGRALDLAGGPGDLALALAEHTPHVALMELSRGFLQVAARRARAQGLQLETLHDSCNRLVHRDEGYDLITVSQALHWLDDVQVCRGVCRVLQPDGSFFVVHSAIELPDAHPLAYLLGHDSVLGAKARVPFADEVQPLARRLSLLFEALDAPEVQRVDLRQGWAAQGAGQRIVLAGAAMFAWQRPFGPGYARGFLTPRHIERTGLAPDAFWADLARRCAGATAAQLQGVQRFAVLHFQRGAAPLGAIDWAALPQTALAPVAMPV